MMIIILLIFIISLILDLSIGEFPNIIHPTVWFGKIIGFINRKYNRRYKKIDFIAGTFSSFVVILFAIILSLLPNFLPYYASIIFQIYFLKSSFSIRSLVSHVKDTMKDNMEEERKYVQKIVSRDTKKLDKVHLNSAAIESLAENTNDAIIAPIFYFLFFGLPGALVYRAINTMDAMIGYKKPKYLYFGKFAARCDDFLNYVPSRITVFLLIPFNPRKVIRYWKRAKHKINGDKPVAGMSAVLGVMLEKEGVYKFEGRKPGVKDIGRALKIFYVVMAEWILFISISLLFFAT